MMSVNTLVFAISVYFLYAFCVGVRAQPCPDQGTCARRRRFDCLPHTIDKSNCPPQCNKCPLDFPLVRQCQTPHRACILENKSVFTNITSKSSCESVPGGVWCDGDTEQICVESQPVREECFNRIDQLTPCGENCIGHSDIRSCHLSGCLWCDEGTVASKNRCFQKDANSCQGDTCCYKDTCLAGNFTEEECADKCCEECYDDGSKRCIFPRNNTFVVNETRWSDCTRKCGCGIQYRYVNCTNKFSPWSCKVVYRSCNTQDCELPPGYCKYGVMARYNDNTMCCANHTFACGRNPLNENMHKRPKRVVGGIDVVNSDKWPWVGVLYTGTTSSVTSGKCTVTLVGDCWVITSKHCVGNVSTAQQDGVVHLGITNRAMRPKHQSKIDAFITLSNSVDAMLAKLTTPVPLEYPHISPICMPNYEYPVIDRRCVVAGWGRSGPNTTCTPILQEGNIKVLPVGICVNAWASEAFSHSHTLICAGVPEGEIDACAGDEGSPLMCQRCENCGWYLAGIASKYLGCGEKAKPSLYEMISDYTQYIIGHYVPSLDNSTYSSCPPIYSNL